MVWFFLLPGERDTNASFWQTFHLEPLVRPFNLYAEWHWGRLFAGTTCFPGLGSQTNVRLPWIGDGWFWEFEPLVFVRGFMGSPHPLTRLYWFSLGAVADLIEVAFPGMATP